MIEHLNSFIDSLSLDHKRGAAEIVRDAAELFVSISELASQNPGSAEHLFNRAVRRLACGQPTMAPVLNLLNHICHIKGETDGDWGGLSEKLPALVRQPGVHLEEMKRHLAEIPPASNKLIAYSNSSTVAKIIIATSEQMGWPKHIYCGEGRPMMEGLFLARRLTGAGLDTTLFTDAALMSKVTEADAVWVGGDSLSRDGLVNKAGSRALAILCHYCNIPFISIIGSDKLLPTALTPYFRNLPQNPREIGGDDAEGLNVRNEYYETIPLDLVSHIMTEVGIESPEEVVASIEAEPIAPLFAKLVPLLE